MKAKAHWHWIAQTLMIAGMAEGAAALGQPPDEKKIPTLPPTKVEAQPVPTPTLGTPIAPTPFSTSQDSPTTGPTNSGANSIVNGGIFGSLGIPGYRANSATSGTKIDVPLIDFPGVVSVVPQDLIRDQQALRTDDLLRDIPSAVKLGDFRRDAFLIRGFEIRSRDYRWNGFLDPSPASRDLANVERIEVLHGPASVLYGSGQPSGLINFITKKPLASSFNSFNFQVGSFGLERYSVDSTGPINDSGSLLYRVNAAFENRDSFRDFGFGERTFVAPVFTFRFDDCTSLTLEASYLNDRRRFDTGLALLNGQNSLPISRSLNEPNDFQRYVDLKLGAFLTHQLGEGSAARIGAFANWTDNPSFGTYPANLGLPVPAPLLTRLNQDNPSFREQYYSVIGDLNLKADLLGMTNRYLVGAELGWFRSTDFTATQSLTLNPAAPFVFGMPNPALFNAAAPTYNSFLPFPAATIDANVIQERYGLYLQDMLEINDHWKVLAGVRFDKISTDFSNSITSILPGQSLPFVRAQNDAYRTTPRIGLVYQPVPEVMSFYGSYSQAFDYPISGIFANPADLKPETSDAFEAGVKLDLLEKQLSLIASAYSIEKNNVVTFATINPISAFQVGQIRSQGAELSGVGKLTDQWSLVANYAYTDSRITSDVEPTRVGKPFRNVPYNTASLWSRFNLVDCEDQTFGLAAGIVYVGERGGDLDHSFNLAGYTRYDGGIYYRYRHFNASLYAENVFDRRYDTGSVDSLAIFPGAPFTVRMNLGFTY